MNYSDETVFGCGEGIKTYVNPTHSTITTTKKETNKTNERYYWQTQDGTYIPVDELTPLHVCNIVMKFGKDKLHMTGHSMIVHRFDELNSKYKFFDILKEK